MVVFKIKWLFSGKLVVFGKSGSIRAKVLDFSGKSGCIGDVWLYAVKVVAFGQK